MVKLLLQYGADPNEEIDSGASATAFAATPEIRVLLEAHGGDLGEYDTSWIEHNDELLTRVAANQSDPHRIGAAFAMSAHRPDLLARLLGAGLRMPAVHTSCQGYLVEFLLSRGAPVDLPDDEPWATPLGWAERRGYQQIASILRAHGATR